MLARVRMGVRRVVTRTVTATACGETQGWSSRAGGARDEGRCGGGWARAGGSGLGWPSRPLATVRGAHCWGRRAEACDGIAVRAWDWGWRFQGVGGCGRGVATDTGAKGSPGAELVRAAKAGDLAAVQKVLGRGADGFDVNAREEGETALFWAAAGGHEDTVRALLAVPGIDVSPSNREGTTPLHGACSNGHAVVVQALLGAPGIDVNATNKSGSTPLHSACHHGHTAVVQALLGAPGVDDVNATNIKGITPLHDACSNGHAVIVQALLGTPAINVNATNKSGSTPLHLACRDGHTAVVQALLGAPGIDVNATNKEGQTWS